MTTPSERARRIAAMTEPTPEAGRVEEIRGRHEKDRAENPLFFHPAYPDDVYRDRSTLLAALTTQAETIRQLEMANGLLQVERIGHAEKIHDQAETIRRLEGEVARLTDEMHVLAERKAAEYHERCCIYKQRAEAAKGLVLAVGQLREHTWTDSDGGCRPGEVSMREWVLLIRRVLDMYDPSPATGEGA